MTLLTPQHFHDYQREITMHQLTHPDSMVFAGMGLGKTVCTLTTIVDRMRAGQMQKTLIFAPLRVVQGVWAREARKWTHTKHLRFSVVHGKPVHRTKALFADADIFLINYENMNWLANTLNHYYISQGKPIPFQMVVYDEVSKLKNSTSLRMKGGSRDKVDEAGLNHVIKITGWKKMIDHFAYHTGLTGTPASNGYIDLHGQFLAVDGGERLGKTITHYRNSYFESDYMGWSYSPTEAGKKFIEQRISDITINMDTKDYLDLPDVTVTNMLVELPPKARKAYDDVERDLFTKLDTGTELEVFSRSSVSNKSLQFCNGSPYLVPEMPEYEALHDAKLDALDEVLEEAAGAPVLCSYTFKADAERIMKKFKKYNPVNLTSTKSNLTESVINKWNAGGIKLMVAHPACLHADTLVLTERSGWVRIVDVKPDDRVHDGVEFVSHKGCMYSGYKEVITVFGLTMTPDHKLLIDGEWVEGRNVKNNKKTRESACYREREKDDTSCSGVPQMRSQLQHSDAERSKAQQKGESTLCEVYQGHIPQHDEYSHLQHVAGSCHEVTRHIGQKLCRSWNRCVRSVEDLCQLLRGHVRHLQRRFHHRENRCEQRLLERKLHMGDNVRSAVEQTDNSSFSVRRATDTPCWVVPSNRVEQDDVENATEPRNECRPSCARCNEFALREKHDIEKRCSSRKSKVYDLVDCGKRSRFLVKNDIGEVFISHNSAGHGIDGLQDSGSIVVWFGLNWSLELYEQLNARIDRQGQTKPVSIIRILCKDTVDLAVADSLSRKTDDQAGLRSALQRYRDGVTTNELKMNFL